MAKAKHLCNINSSKKERMLHQAYMPSYGTKNGHKGWGKPLDSINYWDDSFVITCKRDPNWDNEIYDLNVVMECSEFHG